MEEEENKKKEEEEEEEEAYLSGSAIASELNAVWGASTDMRRRWGVGERGHHREELVGHRREREKREREREGERGRASRERNQYGRAGE